MTQYVKKIAMLGNPTVGKTSLVRKFVHNIFEDKYLKTLGAKPAKKVITLGEDEVVLMIWDIAGHSFYLHNQFYSGSKGAILVCDLTRKDTLEAMEVWQMALKNKVGDIPILALGNKSDLFNTEFDKTNMEALGFESEITSAKTGDHVEEAFTKLARMMIDE